MGYKLLFGNDDLCMWMSDYRAAYIPLSEGTHLFRNRDGGLILVAKYFMVKDKIPLDKRKTSLLSAIGQC